MTKALAHTYSIAHEYRRQITLALITTGAVFAIVYAVNLYRLVSYSVALRQVTTETATINTALDVLDADYSSISKNITLDTIHTRGFGQTEVSDFIPRAVSLGLGRLSSAGHEL